MISQNRIQSVYTFPCTPRVTLHPDSATTAMHTCNRSRALSQLQVCIAPFTMHDNQPIPCIYATAGVHLRNHRGELHNPQNTACNHRGAPHKRRAPMHFPQLLFPFPGPQTEELPADLLAVTDHLVRPAGFQMQPRADFFHPQASQFQFHDFAVPGIQIPRMPKQTLQLFRLRVQKRRIHILPPNFSAKSSIRSPCAAFAGFSRSYSPRWTQPVQCRSFGQSRGEPSCR